MRVLPFLEKSCNLCVKDLTLVSGETIHLHYYLQARPRLMVGFLVFVFVTELTASWHMGNRAVTTAGTIV